MKIITLNKRKAQNINVKVDDDVFDFVSKKVWVDHPRGAINYKSKKDYVFLAKYIWNLKIGFLPKRIYFKDGDKYNCQLENLTNKYPYKPKFVPINKSSLQTYFKNGRMVGTWFLSKKNSFLVQRKHKGKTISRVFSCRKLGYNEAKQMAEGCRKILVNLNNEDLEKALSFKRFRDKKITLYKFTDLTYDDNNETVENFIFHNKQK